MGFLFLVLEEEEDKKKREKVMDAGAMRLICIIPTTPPLGRRLDEIQPKKMAAVRFNSWKKTLPPFLLPPPLHPGDCDSIQSDPILRKSTTGATTTTQASP